MAPRFTPCRSSLRVPFWAAKHGFNKNYSFFHQFPSDSLLRRYLSYLFIFFLFTFFECINVGHWVHVSWLVSVLISLLEYEMLVSYIAYFSLVSMCCEWFFFFGEKIYLLFTLYWFICKQTISALAHFWCSFECRICQNGDVLSLNFWFQSKKNLNFLVFQLRTVRWFSLDIEGRGW